VDVSTYATYLASDALTRPYSFVVFHKGDHPRSMSTNSKTLKIKTTEDAALFVSREFAHQNQGSTLTPVKTAVESPVSQTSTPPGIGPLRRKVEAEPSTSPKDTPPRNKGMDNRISKGFHYALFGLRGREGPEEALQGRKKKIKSRSATTRQAPTVLRFTPASGWQSSVSAETSTHSGS
jgi:hypothetical protein